uniref:Uncharacterized protein n=1 Tax=Knipowitschia caucasica TaxID=637954 RepID=A0AAV2KFF8_KNICA
MHQCDSPPRPCTCHCRLTPLVLGRSHCTTGAEEPQAPSWALVFVMPAATSATAAPPASTGPGLQLYMWGELCQLGLPAAHLTDEGESTE